MVSGVLTESIRNTKERWSVVQNAFGGVRGASRSQSEMEIIEPIEYRNVYSMGSGRLPESISNELIEYLCVEREVLSPLKIRMPPRIVPIGQEWNGGCAQKFADD